MYSHLAALKQPGADQEVQNRQPGQHISPVHPVARLLTMLEALVGQLYPAITLARLVSLAVMHQKEKP